MVELTRKSIVSKLCNGKNVEIYGTSYISAQNNLNLFHCELKQSLPASIDKSHPNFLTRSASSCFHLCVFIKGDTCPEFIFLVLSTMCFKCMSLIKDLIRFLTYNFPFVKNACNILNYFDPTNIWSVLILALFLDSPWL